MWLKTAILSSEEKKIIKHSLFLYKNKLTAYGGLTSKQEQLLEHIREQLHLAE